MQYRRLWVYTAGPYGRCISICGIFTMISAAAVSVYTPTSSDWVFPFPPISMSEFEKLLSDPECIHDKYSGEYRNTENLFQYNKGNTQHFTVKIFPHRT